MLVLLNGLSKVKGGGEGTIECDKSTITCDVGTTQYEDGIVKCEKKKGNHPM